MGEKGQVWGLVIRAGEACEEHEGPHCTKSGLGKSPKEALDGENPGTSPPVGLVRAEAHAGEGAQYASGEPGIWARWEEARGG